MMPISLRPAAEQDLTEARDWYEQRLAGLGDDFVGAVDQFFERILMFPEAYEVVIKDVRRGKRRRFPYVVYYRLVEARIEILAVLHASRHSQAWKSRIRTAD